MLLKSLNFQQQTTNYHRVPNLGSKNVTKNFQTENINPQQDNKFIFNNDNSQNMRNIQLSYGNENNRDLYLRQLNSIFSPSAVLATQESPSFKIRMQQLQQNNVTELPSQIYNQTQSQTSQFTNNDFDQNYFRETEIEQQDSAMSKVVLEDHLRHASQVIKAKDMNIMHNLQRKYLTQQTQLKTESNQKISLESPNLEFLQNQLFRLFIIYSDFSIESVISIMKEKEAYDFTNNPRLAIQAIVYQNFLPLLNKFSDFDINLEEKLDSINIEKISIETLRQIFPTLQKLFKNKEALDTICGNSQGTNDRFFILFLYKLAIIGHHQRNLDQNQNIPDHDKLIAFLAELELSRGFSKMQEQIKDLNMNENQFILNPKRQEMIKNLTIVSLENSPRKSAQIQFSGNALQELMNQPEANNNLQIVFQNFSDSNMDEGQSILKISQLKKLLQLSGILSSKQINERSKSQCDYQDKVNDIQQPLYPAQFDLYLTQVTTKNEPNATQILKRDIMRKNRLSMDLNSLRNSFVNNNKLNDNQRASFVGGSTTSITKMNSRNQINFDQFKALLLLIAKNSLEKLDYIINTQLIQLVNYQDEKTIQVQQSKQFLEHQLLNLTKAEIIQPVFYQYSDSNNYAKATIDFKEFKVLLRDYQIFPEFVKINTLNHIFELLCHQIKASIKYNNLNKGNQKSQQYQKVLDLHSFVQAIGLISQQINDSIFKTHQISEEDDINMLKLLFLIDRLSEGQKQITNKIGKSLANIVINRNFYGKLCFDKEIYSEKFASIRMLNEKREQPKVDKMSMYFSL
ncbi:UNKNOWN [Stylonychia lemnae]|uniref:Uncharacterized protein n=1 Tax=Stylonychia lemnae TaxID=5949 RepID=A0A077ZPZ0_STYLE|nr:UNKNOWN [Stylonychia lemnae]|eukprot:CDW71529.1 UNKNOWN [Stylonychia lemnae]